MKVLGLFIAQREFIRTIQEKKQIALSILFGFLGTYLLAISSFIARVILERTKTNELFIMLVKEPIISIFYYLISVVLVYFIARLFKGEKRLVEYLVVNGFGGLYSFIYVFTLTPIIIISKYLNPDNQAANLHLVMIILLLSFSFWISIFFAIKYSIVSISEVFKLKIWKSIIVFIIVIVPLFSIVNSFWQVK